MHRVPVPKMSQNESSRPLQLIHTDVCGPMNVNSMGGSKYMLSFTDDYTKYVTVYFLKNKSEEYEKIPRIRKHGDKCHWSKDTNFEK
jgi:hypothetical protein